jgi:hypothetical protein
MHCKSVGHEDLNEISRKFRHDKEKEDNSDCSDYDEYQNNRFDIQHILNIESEITKTCLLTYNLARNAETLSLFLKYQFIVRVFCTYYDT